jgi:pimeloyl-ACP methyl ester carboxylesterase
VDSDLRRTGNNWRGGNFQTSRSGADESERHICANIFLTCAEPVREARALVCARQLKLVEDDQTSMDFSSELRYPTKWYSKLVVAAIAIVFFALLSSTTVSIFLLYRILSPTHTQMDLNATDFPGRPEEFAFTVPGGVQRTGWFFPGLRGAPTVVLCHGYGSSRSELLTLATSIQDRQYNVFIFDFVGHGPNKGYTTMGFQEVRELRAALDGLAQRDDVNKNSFAIWGTNLGAYAALAVAEKDPAIHALILESVYNRPTDFLRLQVTRSGLSRLPLLQDMTTYAFDFEHREDRDTPPLSAGLAHTAGVFKLFLESPDEPVLAVSTHALYMGAPEPKQEAVLAQGNYAGMADDAKRSYENRILSFLLLNLPANPPDGK